MAKVRVPKEHRPPTRFGAFECWNYDQKKLSRFTVSGSYRRPKAGEWIYCLPDSTIDVNHAHQAQFDFSTSRPYVILVPASRSTEAR